MERPKLCGTDHRASRACWASVSAAQCAVGAGAGGVPAWPIGRDVKATLAEALGPEAALLKSTVICTCEVIRDRFDAWTHVTLSGGGAGVPVPGRVPLPDASGRSGRADAPGDNHLRQSGAGRAGTWRQRRPTPLGRVPGRVGASRAARAATGEHRRCRGADRRWSRWFFATSLRQWCPVHRVRDLVTCDHPCPSRGQRRVLARLYDITAEPGDRTVAQPASGRTPSPTATTSTTGSGAVSDRHLPS